MYTPTPYAFDDLEAQLSFIQTYPFGCLFLVTDSGEHRMVHLPVIVNRRGDDVVIAAHVAGLNDIYKCFDGERKVTIVFQGPQGYISPTAYENQDVPTWNYAAVHVTGIPQIVDRAALEATLRAQVKTYEPGDFSLDQVDADYVQKLIGYVVGFEMRPLSIKGTMKMSQSESPGSQDGVVTWLQEQGSRPALELADFMADLRKPKN